MGSLERYPRPNLKILSTNERDETVRKRVILNFFRNILEVTKTPPIHQSDLKKKANCIICEDLQGRILQLPGKYAKKQNGVLLTIVCTDNSNQLHNKLDFLS